MPFSIIEPNPVIRCISCVLLCFIYGSATFIKKHTYLNVLANAEDVADLVEFIASEKARCITGQNYIIDNGRSLGLRGDRNRTDC